jgi:hypothetical protein
MPGPKLSAKAVETIAYLESLLKECDHYAALAEQFAAAKTKNSDLFATQLSRELGQLRQKAMMRNLGAVADSAGQLSVIAARGGSPMMKGRLLRDGVAAFRSLVERSAKATAVADESEQKEKAYLAEKARKAEAEKVKARGLAEEARQAAKAAPPADGTGSAPPPPAPPGTTTPSRN